MQSERPSFASDYMEGAHPAILKRLSEINFCKNAGYGTDEICASAREKIRAVCRCADAAVYFLVGGTQTNAAVITSLLRPWQGVLAAESGHIAGHEAGAVEAGGHKVLTLPQTRGKLSAETIEKCCETWRGDENREHTVMPGMVYLSQPTEYGTLYTLEELSAISRVCRENGMPLYVDGARLAYALACPENDVSLPDLARLCDTFYIGGTKCGALFGEALVVPDPALLPRFFTIMKQRGALLAKGFLLGAQFDTLFTDGLYQSLARSAIAAAERLRAVLTKAGYRLWVDSPTNQVFVILENDEMKHLSERCAFTFWEPYDETHTVVRFVTSWATREEDVGALLGALGLPQ